MKMKSLPDIILYFVAQLEFGDYGSMLLSAFVTVFSKLGTDILQP